MKLIDTLHNRNCFVTGYDREAFNFAFYDEIIGFKDFISMHYTLSRRNDTPYWKHITEGGIKWSPKMASHEPALRNIYIDIAGRTLNSRVYDLDMGGMIYIVAGHGYSPLNHRYMKDKNDRYNRRDRWSQENSAKAWFDYKNNVLMPMIDSLPTHYEYLKINIHTEE
jgi:hypothetical protein